MDLMDLNGPLAKDAMYLLALKHGTTLPCTRVVQFDVDASHASKSGHDYGHDVIADAGVVFTPDLQFVVAGGRPPRKISTSSSSSTTSVGRPSARSRRVRKPSRRLKHSRERRADAEQTSAPTKLQSTVSSTSQPVETKTITLVMPERGPNGQFSCTYPGCSDSFSTRFSLKRHWKRHTGERPFRCSFISCGRRFAERSTLKRHMRTHSGERPYYCSHPGCGRRFADRTNVRRHLMTHGIPSFECPKCQMICGDKQRLQSHLLSEHADAFVNTDMWKNAVVSQPTSPAASTSPTAEVDNESLQLLNFED